MEIKLYTTEDADNVINKTLVPISTVQIQLRDTQNITAPVVLLGKITGIDLKAVNYAYMDEFKRFYFVRSINVGPNNIYALALECDVIETYKEDILASTAHITRSIKVNDYGDITASAEVKKEVDMYESDKGFSGEKSIIFSTIGQNIEEGN